MLGEVTLNLTVVIRETGTLRGPPTPRAPPGEGDSSPASVSTACWPGRILPLMESELPLPTLPLNPRGHCLARPLCGIFPPRIQNSHIQAPG